MVKTILIEQGSSVWHKWRSEGIGASEASVIVNKNPWTTSYQLWREKLGLDPSKNVNAQMKKGIDLEPEARLSVSNQLGIHFVPGCFEKDGRNWMRASLDGISSDNKIAVEIKCPGIDAHSKAMYGMVPDYYEPQLQHQMEVCDLDKIYYYSYREGVGVLLEVLRNDAFIKLMVEQEAIFWECLQTLTPPELTSKDYITRYDDEWSLAADDWKSLNIQRKALEEKEEEARQLLIKLSENRNCKGAGVSACKVVRKGSIVYSDVPELRDVDLEKHRNKPTESWRIA